MTTVRIAHVQPRPGLLGDDTFHVRGLLIVLADDAGHRALPIWLPGGAESLGGAVGLLDRPAAEIVTADPAEALTTRLLRAAGARVTGVDLDVADADAAATRADSDEPDQGPSAARIELGGPAGTRQVTARLGLGLALAAATGAPVRVADAALDRLAEPVAGDDLLGPFLDRVPPAGRRQADRRPAVASVPARRPRFEPRNLDFADGLDRWDLDRGSLGDAELPDHRRDYSCSADGQSAILSTAVPRPAGSAALVQSIFADDYLGATVVFRGEIRAAAVTKQAGLRLEILRRAGPVRPVRQEHEVTASRNRDWTGHEITALIPEDAELIRFGIALTGPGLVALRHAELVRAAPPGADMTGGA